MIKKMDSRQHLSNVNNIRVFSHDVTAVIFVSQDNDMAAMLVSENNDSAAMLMYQTSRVGLDVFSEELFSLFL